MLRLLTPFVLFALAQSANLQLTGPKSLITFDTARLTATCPPYGAAYLKALIGAKDTATYFNGYIVGGNRTIRTILEGVAPLCDGSTIKTPCVAQEGDGVPPLFYCVYSSPTPNEAEVAFGPFNAEATAMSVGPTAAGFRTHLDCPVPYDAPTVLMADQTASESEMMLNLTIRHFALAGVDAQDFSFDGIPLGNQLKVSITVSSPPPPPFSPPTPPPPPPPQSPFIAYSSCKEARDHGEPSGVYLIDSSLMQTGVFRPTLAMTSHSVYCEMGLNGGEWRCSHSFQRACLPTMPYSA